MMSKMYAKQEQMNVAAMNSNTPPNTQRPAPSVTIVLPVPNSGHGAITSGKPATTLTPSIWMHGHAQGPSSTPLKPPLSTVSLRYVGLSAYPSRSKKVGMLGRSRIRRAGPSLSP
mmetsp:Transcript_22780/g.45586  ORF Transcript_22780/g.45586 Transcript_22780/m.45586 type:complete len:115 (-) Transcript_22780:993-1337(-)